MLIPIANNDHYSVHMSISIFLSTFMFSYILPSYYYQDRISSDSHQTNHSTICLYLYAKIVFKHQKEGCFHSL